MPIFERRAAVHAALADPARLRITDVLADGDAAPSELAALLSMPSNPLAHHLRVLEEAGIVARRRSQGGRRRTYLRLNAGTPQPPHGRPGHAAHRVLSVCTGNSAPGPRGASEPAALHWSVPDPVPAGDPASFDAAVAELADRVRALAPRPAPAS